jgi:hypothetical protein
MEEKKGSGRMMLTGEKLKCSERNPFCATLFTRNPKRDV